MSKRKKLVNHTICFECNGKEGKYIECITCKGNGLISLNKGCTDCGGGMNYNYKDGYWNKKGTGKIWKLCELCNGTGRENY